MTRTRTAGRAAATLEAPALHSVGRAAVRATDTDLTLEAMVVPWNRSARVTDDGRTFYDETWGRGSLDTAGRVVVYDGHVPAGGGAGMLNMDRVPIGRAAGFVERDDGLWATITLANTARGRDVYELARTLEYVGVSLEADVPAGATGRVARTAAAPCPLTGIAVVLPPFDAAFPGAVAAARAAATDTGATDTDTDDDDDQGDAAGGDGEATGAGRAAIVEIVRGELARADRAPRRGAPAAGPFAHYGSWAAVVDAARTMPRDQAQALSAQFTTAYRGWLALEQSATSRVGRALVDQITTDNPGLLPPHWLTEVFGIVAQGRPAIMAFGGPRDPGDSGMDVYWPFIDPALDLKTLVAKQAAQKTEIHSVKVSFKRGSATLDTYAGGSDVSYQLQRRSSPGYMSLYDRVLQLSYGMVTEAAFINALVAAGTGIGNVVYDHTAADADGAALKAALFAGSLAVNRATGAPATAAVVSSDVFAALGGQAWLQPPQYGTQNTPGVASASTLRINVSGLEITEAPMAPVDTILMGNSLSVSWFEEGPFLVTAEDVAKLGTDVAIWGMGAAGLFVPKGVVALTKVARPAPPAPDDDDADDDDAPAAKRK